MIITDDVTYTINNRRRTAHQSVVVRSTIYDDGWMFTYTIAITTTLLAATTKQNKWRGDCFRKIIVFPRNHIYCCYYNNIL